MDYITVAHYCHRGVLVEAELRLQALPRHRPDGVTLATLPCRGASNPLAVSVVIGLSRCLAGDPWFDRSALIAACEGGDDRQPPLLPSQFTERLDARAYTEGKDDKALVSRLYAGAFCKEMGRATRLGYGGLGWGDAEAAQVARVITSGALPRLEALSFLLNDVGDDGARALAAALGRKWVATRLSRVDLCGNSIRDGGAKALAAALAKGGACPSLRQLYLDYNCIGDKGAEALAAALGRAGAPQLKRLCLGSNAIGEGGVAALDFALLRRAAIGDESKLTRRGQTPLEIDYNRLTKEGAKRLIARHGRSQPHTAMSMCNGTHCSWGLALLDGRVPPLAPPACVVKAW